MYIMFGVFIAGIVCFVIGSNRADELATVNPGVDFEPLGFGDERRFACEITGVDHTEDSYYRARTKDRKEEARCDDIYSYHFKILVPPRNSSVEYQSREEEFRRSSVNTYINFLMFYVFVVVVIKRFVGWLSRATVVERARLANRRFNVVRKCRAGRQSRAIPAHFPSTISAKIASASNCLIRTKKFSMQTTPLHRSKLLAKSCYHWA